MATPLQPCLLSTVWSQALALDSVRLPVPLVFAFWCDTWPDASWPLSSLAFGSFPWLDF